MHQHSSAHFGRAQPVQGPRSECSRSLQPCGTHMHVQAQPCGTHVPVQAQPVAEQQFSDIVKSAHCAHMGMLKCIPVHVCKPCSNSHCSISMLNQDKKANCKPALPSEFCMEPDRWLVSVLQCLHRLRCDTALLCRSMVGRLAAAPHPVA